MSPILTYHELIDSIVAASAMSDKVLHILFGLAIFLSVMAISPPGRRTGFALASVFALELLNELLDYLYFGAWRLDDTVADIAGSLVLPALIFLLSRSRNQRWHRRPVSVQPARNRINPR